MNGDFLTAQELADLIKVKKTTVYEMIKRGEIPSRKIGKQLRIPLREIEGLLGIGENHTITEGQTQKKRETADVPVQEGFVLCGQDKELEILARTLSSAPGMPSVQRCHAGSYNGLVLLYQGRVHMAMPHLWDEKSGSCNIPYVERLLPGMHTLCVRLFGRMTGFIVQKGNPKGICGWEDLSRGDIAIVNRERGSAMRVLLDEKLKKTGIKSDALAGYQNEAPTQPEAVSAVVCGTADAALGHAGSIAQANADFIPLQKEWCDLVYMESNEEELPYRLLRDYVTSGQFIADMSRTGEYDFTQTGRIFKV